MVWVLAVCMRFDRAYAFSVKETGADCWGIDGCRRSGGGVDGCGDVTFLQITCIGPSAKFETYRGWSKYA